MIKVPTYWLNFPCTVLHTRLLATIAARLRNAAREQDLVARLGGDEFAILQHGVRDAAAVKLARRVARAVEHPIVFDGRSLRVGVSIGIALCPVQGEEAKSLLQRADETMYAAKRSGQPVQLNLPG